MMYKKRIVVQLNELNDSIWQLLYCLIEKCHHRGSFGREDFAKLKKVSIIRFHSVEIQTEEPEDTHFAYGDSLTEDVFFNEINTGTKFVISIVYEKHDDSADFCLFMPFILWLEQSNIKEKGDVTFGVDVSLINNKDEYIFKFGQLLAFFQLPTPSIGVRSLYYIDKSGGSTSRKYSSWFPYKNFYNPENNPKVSGRFLAIMKIEDGILALFQDNQNPTFVEGKGVAATRSWIRESIKILDNGLKMIKPLRDQTFHSLFEEWFVKAYLYSIKAEGKPLVELNTENYNRLKQALHVYCNTIYELVQNILFHTKEKRGFLMIVFNKKRNVSPLLHEKIPHFTEYDDDDRFVEIGLYDYGDVGVIKQFGRKDLTLKSFFDPYEIIPSQEDNIDYLALRYAAHLGIKSFVSTVINHNGYFRAESNGAGGKKDCIESVAYSLHQQEGFVYFPGTHYRIVLPVSENCCVNSFNPIQSASIIDALKAYLETPLIQTIRVRDIVEEIPTNLIDNKFSQIHIIRQIGSAIIAKIRASANGVKGNIAIDMNGYEGFGTNMIFKIISYLQLDQNQFEKIILINLNESIVDDLCDIVRTISDIVDVKRQPIWSNDCAVILVDTNHRTQVLCGETKSSIAYVNRRGPFFSFGQKNKFDDFEIGDLDASQKKWLNRYVIPYDCLLDGDGLNYFLSYVDRILETPIEDSEIGCKVNSPTKIGSKLYIDHYYEADFLFQNSFFADRFAFFLAREIVSQVGKTSHSIVIIGYNPYSELLIERVRRFIKDRYQSRIITAIAEANDDTNGLKFLVNGNLSTKETFDLVTIVPIASTLTTHDKIVAGFKQTMKEIDIGSVHNYCAILVRDDYKNKVRKRGITDQEKARKWVKVIDNKVVTDFPNAQEITYLLSKSCGWHDLIDNRTFPTNFWDELYINQTRNSALNIRDFIKYPVAAIPPNRSNNNKIKDYYAFTEKRLQEMAEYIYYGHIIHKDDHHRYYFDIRQYIEDFENKSEREKRKTQLYKWVTNFLPQKNELLTAERLNVIVTSDPDSDPHFASFINKYLFDDNAYILFLNIKDYPQNTKVKHSFFKRFSSNVGETIDSNKVFFHFVDQALVTGRSYQKAKSYMASILDDPTFRFDSIITIINRLSKDRYEEISADLKQKGNSRDIKIFSYNHFFILPSKLQDTECSLCRLKDYFEFLKKHSVITECRNVIEENRIKYIDQPYETYRECSVDIKPPQKVSADSRYWKRMKWRDRLFYEISNIVGYESADKSIDEQRAEVEQKLDWLYDKCKDIDDKISFLKGISYPPLSEYVSIRKYAFGLMLKQLKDLLDNEEPQIYDLFLLKVLLKHLAMLGSNALVRRDVIIGCWRLFCVIKDRLPDEIKQIRESIEQIGEVNKESNKGRSTRRTKDEQLELFFEEQSEKKTILETRLKYIYEYTNISGGIVDSDLIKSCVMRDNKLNKFVSNLHFYIKLSTHKDEGRSLWLGELLRTGSEINVLGFEKGHYDDSYLVSKTTLYNSLFKMHQATSDFNRKVLPYLFYDNTAIIRKTLDDFEKDLKHNDELRKKFYDQNGNLSFTVFQKNISQIVRAFSDKVQRDYYYSWFKCFLQKSSGKISDKSPDGIPLILKHVQILFARLTLQDLLNPSCSNKSSFDKNAELLLEIFTKIMDAKASFIAIKPRERDQVYTLARHLFDKEINYDDSFCKELLYEKNEVEKARPFVIRKSVPEKGEGMDGLFNRATFLKLDLLDNLPENNNQETDTLVGIVAFLYNDSRSNNRFMIEQQELGRLLLLLKPETDAYVKHVANDKQFEVWKERQYNDKMLQKINYKSGHRFIMRDSDFRLLSDNEYYKVFNEFFTMSNIVVSYVFSLIVAGKKLDFSSSDYALSQIFDSRFMSLLDRLNFNKWSGLFDNTINIKYDFQLSVNLFVFQSFIVQCLDNVRKHPESQKGPLKILFYKNRLEIVNPINDEDALVLLKKKTLFDEKYNLKVINENINLHKMEGYGLTLVSFIKYCDSVNLKCVPEYNISSPPEFKVKIFF